MNERRLAITKKISLADLSEGWEDCYAIVRPATYADYRDFTEVDFSKLSPTEQIKLQMDFVAAHFVSGTVKVFDDTGAAGTTAMTAEDIEQSTDLSNVLFLAILGVKPDPKDLSTLTAKS